MPVLITATGPTALRTFLFPDANAKMLTSAAAVLPAEGGTGLATYAAGDLLVAAAPTVLARLAAGPAGQVLTSSGPGVAPAWAALPAPVAFPITPVQGGTGLVTYAAGDLLVASAANVLGRLAAGPAGDVLTSGGPGVAPAWAALPAPVAFPITPTQGGTGLVTYAAGDLLVASAANVLGRLAAGPAGDVLTSGGPGVAPAWAALPAPVAFPITPTQGGTGLVAYTAGDLLVAAAPTVLGRLAAGPAGQVLTSGGAGVAPAWAALPGLPSPLVAPVLAGGTAAADSLTLKPTTGAGTTGADVIIAVGNNGANPVLKATAAGAVVIGAPTVPLAGDKTLSVATISGQSVARFESLTTGPTQGAYFNLVANTNGVYENGVQFGNLGGDLVILTNNMRRLTLKKLADFLAFGPDLTNAGAGIKRVGADLQIRLADDADFANLLTKNLTVNTGAASAVLSVESGGMLRNTGFGGGAGLNFMAGNPGAGASRNFAFVTNYTAYGMFELMIGVTSSGTGLNATVQDWTALESHLFVNLEAKSLRGKAVPVANLPTVPVAGMLVHVTDANTAAWGATIAGGGANKVLAHYNGAAWTVAGV